MPLSWQRSLWYGSFQTKCLSSGVYRFAPIPSATSSSAATGEIRMSKRASGGNSAFNLMPKLWGHPL